MKGLLTRSLVFLGLLGLSSLIVVPGAQAGTLSFMRRPVDLSLKQNDLRIVLTRLGSVPTGALLLKRARALWKVRTYAGLARHLRLADSSRTDAVLIRRFDSATGKESRDREITIYVRASQTADDALLDLAHELVHATSRPDWDPYDPELTAGEYIENAIEGKGGEIEAVRAECQVGFQLSLASRHSRCDPYVVQSQVQAQKLKKDFYRVGSARDEIVRSLGAEASRFPELSEASVVLYSSTGRAPYPQALMEEYKALTRTACVNMSRLIDREQESAEPDRSPAALAPKQAVAQKFLDRRCASLHIH
jgi:hypothetical protein